MKAANYSQTLTPNRLISTSSLNETSPKVLIYADGSCLKNGSDSAQAGAGVVIMTEDQKRIKLKACYLGALTNQKAEILACAVGLESLKLPCRVRIFSDSKYVVETMQGLNRMKSNREFWNRLVTACLTHQIEWTWVRGHNGDAFQETADRLSRAAASAKENLDKITLDRLALMLVDKPDEDTLRMIHNGLKTLAMDCDGAKRADGQGFNKFDTELGKRFARKPILNVSEALIARNLLTKYRGQIAKFDEQLALIV
ncbi:MAG: ribonuclease HI [Aridibacter sp.]